MSDEFINAIESELNTYSTDNDLGWTVIKQNSPNRKQYNQTPLVTISPSKKDNVKVNTFCTLNIESSYDVFLVNQGDLASNYEDDADQFQNAIIDIFMPQPQSMTDAGSWQNRVSPKYDFNRSLYP